MSNHSSSTEPDIIETANEIVCAAAETALGYFRNPLDIDLKGDDSPVTLADRRIEKDARDLLNSRFPDHSILGEEYGAGDLSKVHVWVIDPIDGTRSFISGHPLFGFLLAHMTNGHPTLGIISMPALDEVFVGVSGMGATQNGSPTKVSDQTKLADAILAINEGEKLYACEPDAFSRLVQAGHTRRFGYDCYPHALLAAGHIDAVVDYDLKPFDYLPLAAVIEASGGVISDWNGQPLGFNSDGRVVSASTPELHAELLHLLSGRA
ncbi:inositol monophosphatase family protein [Hoeflea sp. TYP-13]|uniref:inositol monophosphatase family protein n=1 Tax=Hoeflea sp. TYP-13 TaxID=3230023 RepID=UPI0034C6D970